MTTFTVILGILVILLLIAEIRIGGEVEYAQTGVTAQVRVGSWKKKIYPAEQKPEKKEKKVKKTPEQEAAAEPKQEKRGGKLSLFRELLPIALEAAGELKRKIRIDLLTLHLTWASDNPASTAMGYGAANAAVGMIYPVLDQNFKIKKSDVGIALDFERVEPEIYANAAISLTIGQVLALVLHYGIKAILVYMNQREKPSRTNKKKEAVTDERTEASH